MTDPGVVRSAGAVVVVDSPRTRLRRPADLVRFGVLVLILLALAGLGSVARDTGSGVSEDLTRLVGHAPHAFIRIFTVLGTVGALAIPLSLMVGSLVRGQTRRLFESVLIGLIAVGVVEVLDRILALSPSTSLYRALTTVGTGVTVRPLDAYLAGLVGFVTIIGLREEPYWRGAIVAMTAFYLVSSFAITDASLLSLLVSSTIGAMVAVLARYVGGRQLDHPDGYRVVAELARRGLPLRRLERVEDVSVSYRCYLGTDTTDQRYTVHVFDRDLVSSGAIAAVYRAVRLRREIAPPSALSLERVAERRSLLALATEDAEVPVPPLLAGVSCGPDTIVLAYRAVDAVALTEPEPAQLDELWALTERLHARRITHRGLAAGRVLVGSDGHVMLPIPVDGSVFATDLRITFERAQLLMTCTQLAGPEEAVRSARTVLSAEEVSAALPLLQPVAFERATRTAIARDPALLEGLRAQIHDETTQDAPEPVRVERVRPRTVISVAALVVAGYLIVGQFGTVDIVSVLDDAQWRWIPLVVAASIATYLAAALALIGYVRERLPFGRTALVQLAASFAGFVTPPAVGGLAVNIRYLRRSRVTATGAATSVALTQVVNAASHVVLLTVFAAATGTAARHSLPIPGWAFVLVGALAVLVLAALTVPAPRRALAARLLPPLREALPRLLDLVTSPVKLVEGLSGALLLNAAYIGALWFAVHAFNGTVNFPSVAVVYLTGAAIGSLAPTPGGLGAVEVALSTGLAAAGMAGAAAVSAVLLFRIATFWLPVPFGWAALHYLQRRELV